MDPHWTLYNNADDDGGGNRGLQRVGLYGLSEDVAKCLVVDCSKCTTAETARVDNNSGSGMGAGLFLFGVWGVVQ